MSEFRKWTIQRFYTTRDDNGKQFRATAAYQTEAATISDAYRNAELAWPGEKFGAILPGHHVRFP